MILSTLDAQWPLAPAPARPRPRPPSPGAATAAAVVTGAVLRRCSTPIARSSPSSKSTGPHIALHNVLTIPFATVPVGPAASNLRAPTRPMARAPVGNAKTHSTPSHYDGVEHKWWLPSPPPPPPPPPWASNRRPRHHIRRRLRRAARCVGAFPAAPAQHARALRAIDPCLNGEDGMALQRLAARYRPAALRQPDLERGSARWAVDLEPGGGRRRAKAARHGRRTTARAERQSTCTSPWEKFPKTPESLKAPLRGSEPVP